MVAAKLLAIMATVRPASFSAHFGWWAGSAFFRDEDSLATILLNGHWKKYQDLSPALIS